MILVETHIRTYKEDARAMLGASVVIQEQLGCYALDYSVLRWNSVPRKGLCRCPSQLLPILRRTIQGLKPLEALATSKSEQTLIPLQENMKNLLVCFAVFINHQSFHCKHSIETQSDVC